MGIEIESCGCCIVIGKDDTEFAFVNIGHEAAEIVREHLDRVAKLEVERDIMTKDRDMWRTLLANIWLDCTLPGCYSDENPRCSGHISVAAARAAEEIDAVLNEEKKKSHPCGLCGKPDAKVVHEAGAAYRCDTGSCTPRDPEIPWRLQDGWYIID